MIVAGRDCQLNEWKSVIEPRRLPLHRVESRLMWSIRRVVSAGASFGVRNAQKHSYVVVDPPHLRRGVLHRPNKVWRAHAMTLRRFHRRGPRQASLCRRFLIKSMKHIFAIEYEMRVAHLRMLDCDPFEMHTVRLFPNKRI